MPKSANSSCKRLIWRLCLLMAVFVACLIFYSFSDVQLRQTPLQFSLRDGSSLRSVARQLQAAGALNSPRHFELLARLHGDAGRIQAGSYELNSPISPLALLRKITSGDRVLEKITFLEGWTFRQLRMALDMHPALKHDTQDLSEPDILARLETPHTSAEGLFFPDTYYFSSGGSDIAILRRAYGAMQLQLDGLWNARAGGLPLGTEYKALILASIVEKETGQSSERPLIAAVFINRLQLGMKLQTDPTVIYGLGAQFDGNLRKFDLLRDGPYNTYVRAGLPPTPIAIPGLGALTAVLNPAQSRALYFVSRGDGSSHFSNSLAEHERAVTKYQRRGNR